MRKQWILFAVVILLIVSTVGSVRAKSFSNQTAGTVSNGTITRTITINPTDFSSSTVISDVNITIRFGHRHTATCSETPSGFYNDVAYRLEGPDGTIVNLINANSYGFGDNASYVTVEFDDSAGAGVGPQPRSGRFRPAGSLSAFNGRSPFGTWTLHIIDANFNGTHCFSWFSLNVNPPNLLDVDLDGDGLAGFHDNCPTVFNPDQEDGWGSGAGDACDTDWYNLSGQGLSAFVQKNGLIHLHGNCLYLPDGAPRCPVIAAIDPATLRPSDAPLNVTSPTAKGWSAWLHYLYTTDGVSVYQVNTYRSATPQLDKLVDDHFEIHVGGDSWRWWHRGGSPASIVTYYPLENEANAVAPVESPEVPVNRCQPSRLSWISCAIMPGV